MGAFLLIVGFLMLTTIGSSFGVRLPIHGPGVSYGFMVGLMVLGAVIAANLWRHSRMRS